MISASRARAESRFSEIERRQQKALSETEAAALAVNENMARLKALRLAKEQADRDAAEEKKRVSAERIAARKAK